jgi:hypothetical protein
MSEIPLEIAMHAERLYDEGGYESAPTIIAKAILAERERCALIAEELPIEESSIWSAGSEQNACLYGQEYAASAISEAIRNPTPGEGK